MAASARLSALQRSHDDFVDGGHLSTQVHLAGVDESELCKSLDKAIESVCFLVNYFEHFFATFITQLKTIAAAQRVLRIFQQGGNGSFDGSQGRAQVMC